MYPRVQGDTQILSLNHHTLVYILSQLCHPHMTNLTDRVRLGWIWFLDQIRLDWIGWDLVHRIGLGQVGLDWVKLGPIGSRWVPDNKNTFTMQTPSYDNIYISNLIIAIYKYTLTGHNCLDCDTSHTTKYSLH